MMMKKVAGILVLFVSCNCMISAGFELEMKCCVNDTQFDQDKNACKDPNTGKLSQMTLICSKYMLDPEIEAEDEFRIIGDGSLVVGDIRIEKGE